MTTVYINDLGLALLPWRRSAEFDYDAGLVEAIKRKVPSRSRKWDAVGKRWLLKDVAAQAVYSLARQHGMTVAWDTSQPSREAVKLQRRGHGFAIILRHGRRIARAA